MKEIDVAPIFYSVVFLYIAITGVRIWWRRVGGLPVILGYLKGNVMSSDAEADEHVTGIYTSMHTGMAASGMDRDVPGIDASNTGMPRLSRDITVNAEIAFLAVIRNPDQTYRHSANKIAELVGGDRNAVLAKIKEIRGGDANEPRTLRVRDNGADERVIPFRGTDTDFPYEAPPR